MSEEEKKKREMSPEVLRKRSLKALVFSEELPMLEDPDNPDAFYSWTPTGAYKLVDEDWKKTLDIPVNQIIIVSGKLLAATPYGLYVSEKGEEWELQDNDLKDNNILSLTTVPILEGQVIISVRDGAYISHDGGVTVIEIPKST